MDAAQYWQEAIASLARLSPVQRLIRLLEVPGGEAPAALRTLVADAIVERIHGRELALARWHHLAGLILAFGVASASFAAPADTADGLPDRAQVRGAYLSTILLVDPCYDGADFLDGQSGDDDVRVTLAQERAAYPANACDQPRLVQKLYEINLMQYAALARVQQPWRLWEQIESWQARFKHCTNLACLERELDAAIARFKPIYADAMKQTSPWQAPAWCEGTDKELDSTQIRKYLDDKFRKEVDVEMDGWGGEIEGSLCSGSHGRILSVRGKQEGNQVNSPEWVFRLSAGKIEELAFSEGGPFGALSSGCMGWPDLVTSVRVNAGERAMEYWRFDGDGYRSMFAYTMMGIGGDGVDIVVAQGVEASPVRCPQ
ncbi:MAG: hypothetical protein QM599_02220 [Pseudoxanthomonas sp.]